MEKDFFFFLPLTVLAGFFEGKTVCKTGEVVLVMFVLQLNVKYEMAAFC